MIVAILGCVLAACGDDEEKITLCGCSPDQYCVDDTCYDTDGNVVPAPDEE